jgi:pimeloyl-ACP methyl ester carboxylesterase
VVRTILTWRILDEPLVGTCHVPTPGRAGGLSGAPSVGILLLNAASAPRSGNSDLSVRIGDRLALRGFPVFRFDLPGLGDSSGSLPTDVDAYWDEVLEGRNDETTAALIERIQVEFGVARVVVGGLCAATVPMVRALSHAGVVPAGLLLLEPNFRMHPRDEPGRVPPVERIGPLARIAAGLRHVSSAMGLRGESWLARMARPLHAFLGAVERRFGPALPRDANLPLTARWQEGLARGVRSLVVVATGETTDHYVARILASMPSRATGLVSCVGIPGTNHLFTSGAGQNLLLAAVERWVIDGFGGNAESAEAVFAGGVHA